MPLHCTFVLSFAFEFGTSRLIIVVLLKQVVTQHNLFFRNIKDIKNVLKKSVNC